VPIAPKYQTIPARRINVKDNSAPTLLSTTRGRKVLARTETWSEGLRRCFGRKVPLANLKEFLSIFQKQEVGQRKARYYVT